ncbi:MAG: hypothetical protein CXR30_19360 [Geobacter sp.]|nr:MAG: hypothetical protein CXR30_19360 [Geobacter sp.]
MNDDCNKVTKFWSLVGKMATLAALILGVIQLISIFNKSDYSIEAKGFYADQKLPFNMESEIEKFEKTVDANAIKSAIDITLPKDSTIDRYSLERSINNNIEKPLSRLKTISHELNNINTRWIYTIQNIGKKEIQDMKLEVPFDGYYFVARSDGSLPLYSFNKIISLGPLRPSNKITLTMWSNYSPSWYEDNLQITHPAGVFKVTSSKNVTGILAWLADDNHFMLTILVCVLFTFSVFIIGVIYGPTALQFIRKL